MKITQLQQKEMKIKIIIDINFCLLKKPIFIMLARTGADDVRLNSQIIFYGKIYNIYKNLKYFM